jgi:hypothetical protein
MSYGHPNFHTQTGDPVSDFDAAVRARCPQGRQPSYSERQQAISYVARTNPKLHAAYLAATNHGPRAARLLAEKLGK